MGFCTAQKRVQITKKSSLSCKNNDILFVKVTTQSSQIKYFTFITAFCGPQNEAFIVNMCSKKDPIMINQAISTQKLVK